MENIFYLVPLFFLTALIYASVGFGGGSTYLALLVLFNLPYLSIPKVALICNLVVVTGGLYHYIRNCHLPLKVALPFAIASVPMAYLGGSMPVGKNLFLILLGISLMGAGLRLLFFFNTEIDANHGRPPKADAPTWGLIIGAPLGFLSGLTGIGGGI
ncbi:MAG: sulfite exporter TauE/SafE family protein, partial [Deltaproteobacteria bacterium]|nr:sulfite exporter TauE/SafE family protein [Deltaproteobacteria bacterium]